MKQQTKVRVLNTINNQKWFYRRPVKEMFEWIEQREDKESLLRDIAKAQIIAEQGYAIIGSQYAKAVFDKWDKDIERMYG